jgi:hypothetical protein
MEKLLVIHPAFDLTLTKHGNFTPLTEKKTHLQVKG